jgi:hypothetical protein
LRNIKLDWLQSGLVGSITFAWWTIILIGPPVLIGWTMLLFGITGPGLVVAVLITELLVLGFTVGVTGEW